MRPYERDPQAIYAASFATVRAEANLDRFPADMAQIATRVIHACGMVEVADRLAFSLDILAASGRAALATGAPVYTDCEMVPSGLDPPPLPFRPGGIRCTLNHPRTAELAESMGTTRSAAAIDLWEHRWRDRRHRQRTDGPLPPPGTPGRGRPASSRDPRVPGGVRRCRRKQGGARRRSSRHAVPDAPGSQGGLGNGLCGRQRPRPPRRRWRAMTVGRPARNPSTKDFTELFREEFAYRDD